jgi:hypothetical protein
MRSWAVPLALAILASGCTHNQLIRSTNVTQMTMADLRFKHILDNVAMFVRNPAALPNPVAITAGVVQISDNGSVLGNITWNPFGMVGTEQYFLGGTGSRTVSEQWSLIPIHNPEKLRLQRCAFQLLVGSDLANCDDCVTRLRKHLGEEEFATAIPQGWFHVGTRKDVPKDARYCGHYHNVYVWVTDDGLDGLSRFTLTLLRIVLTDAYGQTAQVVRIYEGPISAQRLKSTEVRTTEALPVQDQPSAVRPTGEFPAPTTGLQFVPLPKQ